MNQIQPLTGLVDKTHLKDILSVYATSIKENRTKAAEAYDVANSVFNQGRIFSSIADAEAAILVPKDGYWVLIDTDSELIVYRYSESQQQWVSTGKTYEQGTATTADQITDSTLSMNQQAVNRMLLNRIVQLETLVAAMSAHYFIEEGEHFDNYILNEGDLVMEMEPDSDAWKFGSKFPIRFQSN